MCFEGAEKILHAIAPHASEAVHEDMRVKDPGHLEEKKVRGAIKTDFILSAEIMTISLAAIPDGSVWTEALALATVGVGITLLVYGSVAIIVKADDVGLTLARVGRLAATRAVGRGLVRAMPAFLLVLSVVGTAAMVWVGGNIMIHGLADLGWPLLYDTLHEQAERVAHAVGRAEGLVAWAVTAAVDGVLGLVWGLALIPVATWIVGPLVGAVTRPAAEGQ